MALTEAGLWPYRGESWREKADGVCLHTELCCPLSCLQHMAKALGLNEVKKKEKTSTVKTGWKSTSLARSVWGQIFRLKVRHATFDW